MKQTKDTPAAPTRPRVAYRNLQKYRKKQNAPLDYREELASALEEKYETLR